VIIYAFNERSIKLREKLGFQHEGRLRRMIYTGGEFHDEIYMGMTREEFAERMRTL
jgi:RimJ/RimL family protein N-acetyltransferase